MLNQVKSLIMKHKELNSPPGTKLQKESTASWPPPSTNECTYNHTQKISKLNVHKKYKNADLQQAS